jgi:ethanolamine ammonia-lyase small subunit
VNTDINKTPDSTVTEDLWTSLKRFTEARIALGRCGVAPPLSATLDFRLAHAQARDAIYSEFNKAELNQQISQWHPSLLLRSEVEDRHEYLTRPDKGRTLDSESFKTLESQDVSVDGYDLCLIVGDGLSPRAIHENAVEFIRLFFELSSRTPLRMAPVCIVANARVAISDPIGYALKAKVAVMLIGERPGLSSPNSMGIYMTYDPHPGKTDESRNCISNIRPGGMSIEAGVQKLSYLIEAAISLNLSGVNLKDEMPPHYLPFFHTSMLGQ